MKKDSWKIIELVIMRYPETKKEYETYVLDVITSNTSEDSKRSCSEEYINPQSVTEAKALKLSNKYAERLKKEIKAVEAVYNSLSEEEKKVMRIRYWSAKGRKIPYVKMATVNYSERQMKRIVCRIITQVGQRLGEIV